MALIAYLLQKIIRILLHLIYSKKWIHSRTGLKTTHKSQKRVVVVVPFYGQPPSRETIDSILSQRYSGEISVIVVDDGTPENTYDLELPSDWHFIRKSRNEGKKFAHATALRRIRELGWKDAYVLFLDSDTKLVSDELIERLVAVLEEAQDIAGVVPSLKGYSSEEKWLTHYLCRQFLRFHRLRAMQSYFGTQLFLNGPCAMWRQPVLENVLAEYLQGPLAGDENALTLAVLRRGYRIVLVPEVTAATLVPNRLAGWYSQRLRWKRSEGFYLIDTIRVLLVRRKFILLFDTIADILSPYLALLAMFSVTNLPYALCATIAILMVVALEVNRPVHVDLFLRSISTWIHFYGILSSGKDDWKKK